MDIAKIKEWLDLLSHLFFGVVIVSTAIVQLTPTKSDDKALNKVFKKVHWLIAYFPTFGINPKTKEMKEKLEPKDGSGLEVK